MNNLPGMQVYEPTTSEISINKDARIAELEAKLKQADGIIEAYQVALVALTPHLTDGIK